MDGDRIKGVAGELGGKVKDAVGGPTGDTKTRAEGEADQVSGRARDAYGRVKDAVRDGAGASGDGLGAFVKERPVAAPLAAAGLGHAPSPLTHRR